MKAFFIKTIKNYLLKNIFFFVLFCTFSYAQTARIKGVILDEFNQPVGNVSINAGDRGTVTQNDGSYSLLIPSNKKVVVVFSHIAFMKTTVTVELNKNDDYEFNPVLSSSQNTIGEIDLVSVSENRI